MKQPKDLLNVTSVFFLIRVSVLRVEVIVYVNHFIRGRRALIPLEGGFNEFNEGGVGWGVGIKI